MKPWFRLLLLGSMAVASLAQPGTRVKWSSEAGRLDSGRTHAVFTVQAIEDPAHPDQQLRGLRVAVSDADWVGTLFVTEAELPLIKKKIDGLVFASSLDLSSSGPSTMTSTKCPGEKEKTSLDFGYSTRYAAPSKLHISGTGLHEVEFVDAKPTQLVDIFTKAIEELKTH